MSVADARAFAARMNRMLNTTVTDGRLLLKEGDAVGAQFELVSVQGQRPAPLSLRGTRLKLGVAQSLDVRDGCRTMSYSYRLQQSDEDDSWLVRWEYAREPPDPEYRYPLAHAHVNATLRDIAAERHLAKTLAHLHLPTERVPLETVVRHAIEERGVDARERDWRERLAASSAGWRTGVRGE
jgi:hypothetical protein